jgi:hypothetical protein
MSSMYEAYARERMRTRLDVAAQRRLVEQVAAVRLWARVSAFAEKRAARSRRLVDQSAADYQLVG